MAIFCDDFICLTVSFYNLLGLSTTADWHCRIPEGVRYHMERVYTNSTPGMSCVVFSKIIDVTAIKTAVSDSLESRSVFFTFFLGDSRSSFSRFLHGCKRQLPRDFSLASCCYSNGVKGNVRSRVSTCNLSRLNMMATTKKGIAVILLHSLR